MLKIERVVAAALAGAIVSAAAAQDAVQWRVEDGGNGHWYSARRFAAKEDPGGIDRWYLAKDHCESIGGYMATITSAAESSFVWMNIVPLIPPVAGNGRGPNLGGRKVGGGWEWITGEPWSYSEFCPAEPTGDGALLQIWRFAGPCWNDHNGGASDCFLVEWSADCNGDGIVDYGQIQDGTFADQDANGIPDCCDAGRSCPEFLDVPAEYPTIQSALDACPENGVIRLSPGEYSEALEIPARNLTIQGDPEYPTTRQILGCCGTSAVNADGPFDGTLTLKGLSIVGSEAYGVRVDRMGVQIIDCIISGSQASGVILLNEARGDFVRTTFANNNGRGAYAYVASHINADDCDFSGNITASYGSGIGFHVGSSGFIRDCRFTNNLSTSGQGNDVGLSFGGSRVFEGCTFVRGDGVSGPLWWTEFGGSGSSADGVFCGSLPSDISGGFADAGGNQFFGAGCTPRCVEDLTQDGQVGPADLGLLLANYRNYEEFASGDLNDDQEIDAADLGLLIAAWGSCH